MISGSGGVGKTTIAVNLAVALAGRYRRVLLMDGALGAGDIHVALGLYPRYFLDDVLAGTASFRQALIPASLNTSVLAASHDLSPRLERVAHTGIVHAVGNLAADYDYLLVDTGAGLGDASLDFASAVDHVIVVIRDDPVSISDALIVMKALTERHQVRSFGVFINLAQTERSAQEAFAKLSSLCGRFLEANVACLGTLCDDPNVRRMARKQSALVQVNPRSTAAGRLLALAARLEDTLGPARSSGRLQFVAEQLIADGPAL